METSTLPNRLHMLVMILLLANTDSFACDSIVPPDAKLEKVFDLGFVHTEGVAIAPDGIVFFSDVTFSHVAKERNIPLEAGHIWKFDPKSGHTTIFRSPSGMSGGLTFDADGNLLAAEGADFGGRRVTRTEMKTGKSYIIAGQYQGRSFNAPNDLALDEQGRIYVTDSRYCGHEPIDQPMHAVYRIDPDGSVHRVVTDAGKPNGIAISPDQKTLYVSSSDNGHTDFLRVKDEGGHEQPVLQGIMAVLAYDLSQDGSAKFRKIFVNLSPHGAADGLICDKDGNLYAAVQDETRTGVYIYSPEGKELGCIEMEVPTNMAFGHGDDNNLLYITAGKSLYRIRLNARGYRCHPK